MDYCDIEWFDLETNRGFTLAILIGFVCAGLIGFLIGMPVLRIKGDYLAIVTLAFGEIIKNADCRRIDAFELWCLRRLLRVSSTESRSNQ